MTETTGGSTCGYSRTGKLHEGGRPADDEQQADDDGEHGPADEEVGDLHGASASVRRDQRRRRPTAVSSRGWGFATVGALVRFGIGRRGFGGAPPRRSTGRGSTICARPHPLHAEHDDRSRRASGPSTISTRPFWRWPMRTTRRSTVLSLTAKIDVPQALADDRLLGHHHGIVLDRHLEGDARGTCRASAPRRHS